MDAPGPSRQLPWLPLAATAVLVAGALGGLFAGSLLWTLVRCAGLAGLALVAIRRRRLTPWIFWSMAAGAELGLDAPHLALHLRVFSDIFLRLIRTIVAPLLFGTLVSGIAGHGDLKGVGRLGLRSLLYFEVASTLALFIGLGSINLTHAGVGLALPVARSVSPAASAAALPSTSWEAILLHTFPENLARAVADDQILQIAVFAVLFGIALTRVPSATRAPMLALVQSLSAAMFRLTDLVMLFAPLAVGAALAVTVGQQGPGVLIGLGKLAATFYGALLVFLLGVLLPIAALARLPLRRFLRHVAAPATIAFATSTSEAALPRAIEEMTAFGVPERICSFVIPAGYSFNLDGSTLYLAVASIFVAQASGLHLSAGRQLTMMLTLMLTSKGVAGVPRAVLVILLGTASTFHLPPEPIFLMLGIDALMDMGRTGTNVIGNCLASAVLARWEGVFGEAATDPAVLDSTTTAVPL